MSASMTSVVFVKQIQIVLVGFVVKGPNLKCQKIRSIMCSPRLDLESGAFWYRSLTPGFNRTQASRAQDRRAAP